MPNSGRRSSRFSATRLGAAALLAVLLLPAAGPALADTDASDSCTTATALPPGAWHTESLSSSADVDWYRFSTTASVRVLITLGGLDADDRLDLYSACGTLLASSNRPYAQYEELYRAIPAGTFHLRVKHASSPTSTTAYGIRVRFLAYTVQLLSSTGWLEF